MANAGTSGAASRNAANDSSKPPEFGSPTILLKTDFVAARYGAMLGAERARVAQANPVLDARRAGLLNRQRVDRRLERVEQDLADLGLGEVAQHHRVFEIHGRPVEQVLAHEGLHLAVEHVVAADEPQILQQLAREEGDDRAVVGRPGAIELDGVVDLRVEHSLEDDLARLLRGERLERQPRVAERRRDRARRDP